MLEELSLRWLQMKPGFQSGRNEGWIAPRANPVRTKQYPKEMTFFEPSAWLLYVLI